MSATTSSTLERHKKLERNVLLLGLFAFLAVMVGGIVEIAPLFWIDNTIEKVNGVRPYTPLEQAGRNIYVREGCYLCHSQMIRPFRDEVERYGHYSLAAESMYDHPFQWGSKRTGPDLARVGGKYSDEWHVAHMNDPRSIVPESIMPGYPFLAKRALDYRDVAENLAALRVVGVPYTDEMVEAAKADVERQVDPNADAIKEFLARYPQVPLTLIPSPPIMAPGSPEWQRCVAEAADAPWDILLICLGSPKQERFAQAVGALRNGPGVAWCVGASIDFLTGRQTRAPQWIRTLHMEWLHRLASNPKRLWRRYLVEGPQILRLLARS